MEWEAFRAQARILVVDDQEANVTLLGRILRRAGYENLILLQDPLEVIPAVKAEEPDILLLDLHMPGMDGFEVMEQLRDVVPGTTFLPILVLTADITPEAKQRALSEGAKDFLSKPFDQVEVLLRLRNLLETRMLHKELKEYNAVLEEKVRERTRELEEAKEEILRLLTHW